MARLSAWDVDFAKAICDQMGYKLHVEDMEFDAIIPAVQSGKADFGMAGMTVTPERAESINFTDSYCTERSEHHRAEVTLLKRQGQGAFGALPLFCSYHKGTAADERPPYGW